MNPSSLAWLITIFCLIVVASSFAFVVLNSKTRDEDYDGVMKRSYSIRKKFFVIFLLVGVLVTTLTISNLPYDAHARVSGDAIEVDAVGYQWYWKIDKTSFTVGQPIIFNVTSADVNHGFGIYNDKLALLNQTQAMPGYVNKLVHVFDKPGIYKILCLEYCGLSHHAMVAELTVSN